MYSFESRMSLTANKIIILLVDFELMFRVMNLSLEYDVKLKNHTYVITLSSCRRFC